MWDQKTSTVQPWPASEGWQREWQKLQQDWAAVPIWSQSPPANFTNHFVEVYPNGVRARNTPKDASLPRRFYQIQRKLEVNLVIDRPEDDDGSPQKAIQVIYYEEIPKEANDIIGTVPVEARVQRRRTFTFQHALLYHFGVHIYGQPTREACYRFSKSHPYELTSDMRLELDSSAASLQFTRSPKSDGMPQTMNIAAACIEKMLTLMQVGLDGGAVPWELRVARTRAYALISGPRKSIVAPEVKKRKAKKLESALTVAKRAKIIPDDEQN